MKNNIILNKGWYSHHLLIEYHESEVFYDNQIVNGTVIDNKIKEWWVDNNTHFAYNELKDAKTFRGYIANSEKIFVLWSEYNKNKTVVIFTEGQWLEMIVHDNMLFCNRLKEFDNFYDIFKSKYITKYKKFTEIDLSKDMSLTKIMKLIYEYSK